MARSTEQVVQNHIAAMQTGDFAALMADYADEAVLLTMDGACAGKAAVQGWFVSTLSAMPNAKITFTGHKVEGDYVLLTWSGDSDVASVPKGVDTFVISDDKIRAQTIWYTVAPK